MATAPAGGSGGGYSAQFDGATDRIDLANSADLNVNNGAPFSVSAWIKTDFSDGQRVIVAKAPVSGSSPETKTAALFVSGEGKLRYDNYFINACESSAVVRTGAWVHVAMTYDGSTYRLFVNGTADGTGSFTGSNEAATPWVFTIGQSYNTAFPAGSFKGNIDEVAFWSRALAASEIANLAATGLGAPLVAVATNGGSSAFSSNTAIGTITVNTAPVAADGSLTTIAEDVADANNTGTAISAIVAGSSDADAGAVKGMAVVAVDEANGKWFYTTNGGNAWLSLTGVSPTSARLLKGNDPNHNVRFVPNANYNGTAAFTFRAWDQTSGTAGATGDLSTNGAATAFSSATGTATITITPVDDAPWLAASKVTLNRSSEFTPYPSAAVSLTEGASIPSGARVVGVTLNLEYSTYWSWNAYSYCSLLLNGSPVGALDWVGGATSGGFVSMEKKFVGPLTAYNPGAVNTWTFGSEWNETTLRKVTITIHYEAAGEPAVLLTGLEDAPVAFTAAMFENAFKDIEGSALASIKVLTLPGPGTLRLNGVAVAVDQVILPAELGALTYEPVLNENGPKSFTVTASDGALSSSVATVTVSLVAVNDAPTVSAPTTFNFIEDVADSLAYPSAPFADVDSATLTVTLTVSDGIITGNAGTGITVGGTATARTFSGTVGDLNAYFTTAGKITYQGAANNTASRTLTTTVSDGSLSASSTSTITFTPVNDAPRLFRDGSSAERAAGSATEIKNGSGTNTNGVYWILVNGVATQVYCIMDSAIDGGGWMLAMKGANTGSTFNYASAHWTTNSTLNTGSSYLRGNSSTVNEDAKFDVFNYATAEKVMAIFPDVPVANRGGAVSGQSYGFIWIENMPSPANTASYVGRPAQGNYVGKTLRELFAGGEKIFIRDAAAVSPYRAAGPGVFSAQTDVRFFGFNYQNANGGNGWNRARFGFGWNENGGGL
ncbi:MAG: LamG-like jellyroll fold domain-containing protein, partial [Opitutaceae bacterium]